MANQKINFGKKKKKLNPKKLGITAVAALLVIFLGVKGVGATTSYIAEKKEEKIVQEKKAEAERIAAEKKRKEEEEAKKRMVGVNHDAKQYSYDALKVSEKLKTYDYTNNGEKIVFLTFDDGSSTTVTPQILDTLKQNNVKATFFVTGQNIERGGKPAEALVKRAFDEGNAIANHSYSHDYKYLYPGRTLNLDNFLADFNKTDEILKRVISPYFSTRVLRCPGGHMSWKGMDTLDAYLNENNMASIDWNALNADAEGRKKNASELAEHAKKTAEGKEMVVILMHDTYGKEETAKALPEIIKYFKDNGYEFKTLA
ncbi:polysaccharide deacetylase family protein [Romboutsia lituseburensis]|uniref:polysaccharide deacetylase family protein n=1 Tax=Romboutsia lituseburensis TaxID=1537 RepID=UPI00215B2E31|nr:polysaccharide deacetylase [Romboutsia lituseburensis]MCR8744868.1 polysaccharide deacetylase [Romboutsia lituseburensis]